MSRNRHVEIAGAGFSGLTAAIAFKQRGWSVRIHEAAPELREIGAGLFIWDNGLRVLEAIGAYDEAMEGAHQAPYYETRAQGRTISKNAFGADVGCRMVTLTRPHLYRAISNAARRLDIEIVTGSRVLGATPEGELRTEKGEQLKADLVIGADGVGSKVRESLNIPTERQIFDDGVIRVLADRPESMKGGDWENVLDLWAAPEKSVRILYVPCSPTEVYLAMMSPRTNPVTTAVPVNKEFWSDAIPEMAPIIQSLGTQGRFNAYEMTRAHDWSAGRVALVGDCVNAMPPTLGQGVGCAMMNALALSVILDETDSIEEGLASWEKRERPLTDRTQREACEIAKNRKLQHGNLISVTADSFQTATHAPTGTGPHAH